MRQGREKSYADFVLRLLLEGDAAGAEDLREQGWDTLLRIARRNLVLVRVAERLNDAGLRLPDSFVAAVEHERRCGSAKFELIRSVGRACEERGVGFVFAKAFQHYPDMGGDVDLFLRSRSASDDARILDGMRATGVKNGFLNRVAGKSSYKVQGCEATLEIQHGRMGAIGEHDSYVELLIKNGRRVEIESVEFLVPSHEDQLIVQGMQRVYGRSYIRLADVVYTISTLRRHALDWRYILETARRLGTLYGMSCYLSYVEQIHRRLSGVALLPAEFRSSLVMGGWGELEFRDGGYRFPHVRVASRAYANKFRVALFSGDWSGASKLCLIPLVAMSSALRRLE